MEKKPTNYKITASPKSRSNLWDNIEVLVHGEPNDFMVEFGTATDNTRFFTRLGSLTTLFGGGQYLCRGLKSREELERIESDFWNFVDMKLPSLQREDK